MKKATKRTHRIRGTEELWWQWCLLQRNMACRIKESQRSHRRREDGAEDRRRKKLRKNHLPRGRMSAADRDVSGDGR